jgi:hypothetical protein
MAFALHTRAVMLRNNHVRALGRRVAGVVLLSTLAACGGSGWDDLSKPAYFWSQHASVCLYHRAVDAERNAWEGEVCEAPGYSPRPLGAVSPEAYRTITQGFEALARAEPDGRAYPECATGRYHRFQAWVASDAETTWITCAGPKDDLAGLEEPFVTIAKAFLER